MDSIPNFIWSDVFDSHHFKRANSHVQLHFCCASQCTLPSFNLLDSHRYFYLQRLSHTRIGCAPQTPKERHIYGQAFHLLCARFGIKQIYSDLELLDVACCRPDLCQFLKEWGGINPDDIRANDNQIFRHAVALADLTLCKFFVDWGNLTVNDLRANKNEAFMLAASNNDVPMCQFLIDSGLTIDDISDNENAALIEAACSGSLEVCQFFKKCGLRVSDARSRDNVALKFAAQNGHLHILQFLADWITIDPEDGTSDCLTLFDIGSEGHRAYTLAKKNNNAEVCAFIKNWVRSRP